MSFFKSFKILNTFNLLCESINYSVFISVPLNFISNSTSFYFCIILFGFSFLDFLTSLSLNTYLLYNFSFQSLVLIFVGGCFNLLLLDLCLCVVHLSSLFLILISPLLTSCLMFSLSLLITLSLNEETFLFVLTFYWSDLLVPFNCLLSLKFQSLLSPLYSNIFKCLSYYSPIIFIEIRLSNLLNLLYLFKCLSVFDCFD